MASELAWAAGFFDGEGSAYQRIQAGVYRGMSLQVAQLDRRPLDRFMAAVGHGMIEPRKGKGNTKPHFRWGCYTKAHMEDVINQLWPFLSEPKKEQVLRALKEELNV